MTKTFLLAAVGAGLLTGFAGKSLGRARTFAFDLDKGDVKVLRLSEPVTSAAVNVSTPDEIYAASGTLTLR